MGYLYHLMEQGILQKHTVWGQLPSISRPMYELLLTGVLPCNSGVASNYYNQLSRYESVFHLCRKEGRTTAAAAYCWISELYNHAPFAPHAHRIQTATSLPIQNGIFYWEDDYPDSHLLADAHVLLTVFTPDFLFVHTMGIDHAGHTGGAPGAAYSQRVTGVDTELANMLPLWMEMGYQILITSDHGMDSHGLHGGTRPEERTLPLFLGVHGECTASETLVPQQQLAPLCCKLLGIAAGDAMEPLSAFSFEAFHSSDQGGLHEQQK